MRIEAVSVCLHYDDFLEQTIRVNQSLFDDWVVVTAREDQATRNVCERHGVRIALCPYFERNERFAKALAINIGLAHLRLEDWVMHLDADTALPRNTRKHLANVELDPSCIYGIDRVDCPSLEAWKSYLTDPDPYAKHYFYRGPHDWRIGSRVGHFDYGGYAPIGFFQLWNRATRNHPLPQRTGLRCRAHGHATCPSVAALEACAHPRNHGGSSEHRRARVGRELARPQVAAIRGGPEPSERVRTRPGPSERVRTRPGPSGCVPGRLPPATPTPAPAPAPVPVPA